MGVYITGIYLMGVRLIDVYLIGIDLISVRLKRYVFWACVFPSRELRVLMQKYDSGDSLPKYRATLPT